MTTKNISRILMAVYLVVVFFLCFWNFKPSDEMPRELFGIPTDKLIHFLMFLPFVVLSVLSFHSPKGNGWRFVLCLGVSLLVGCMVAGGIELGQGATAYRSCDPLDFRADAIGLAVGAVGIMIYSIAAKKI